MGAGASSAGRGPAAESRAAVYTLFALVVLSSALGNLSQTGVNAMLATIVADVGVGVDVGQWLTTGYMLTIGIVVPIATYLSRRVSMRHHVLIAEAVFIAGSVCDLAGTNFAVLLVGRLLQAVSVGLLMPLMQTIAITKFPEGKQATAMGISGIAMGFAPNIGPTIGGAMSVAFGWRSFFALLLALNVVLAVLTALLVRNSEPAFREARFDAVSFAFSVLGFGGLLLGVSNASSSGASVLLVAGPIVVGLVFCVLFFDRQKRIEQPLMHLDIFLNREFVRGCALLCMLTASFMGITLVIPLYVEGLCGGTSLDAGLVLLPATIVALVMNPLAGILTDKIGRRPVVIADGTFLAVGAVLACTANEATPLVLVAVYQFVRSIGVSGLMGPLQQLSLSTLEHRLVPDGSSALVLARQTAASLGTSVMVLVIEGVGAAVTATPALAYQLAFGFSAVLSVVLLACAIRWVR